VVNFEKGFTVVTGPNGSGKSNIADAILFAIGENSPKALRAANGRLSGLIYDPRKEDSPTTEKPNACRVTLQFDNSDRAIPVDLDLVTVTRELREDGENLYYLNGRKSTRGGLTEIIDLAGLSPGGLNVVAQGAASAVAEMNPDEKRRMIEGVVGITKFDERKAEALRTLNAADQRIEVAMARIDEQRTVLGSLDTQRNDMVRFNLLESQIAWLNAVQTAKKIRDQRERLSSLKGQERQLNAKLADLNARHAEYQARVDQAEKEKNQFVADVIQGGGSSLVELNNQLQGVGNELDALQADLTEAEGNIPVLEEQVSQLKQNVSAGEKEINAAESSIRRLEDAVARLQEKDWELAERLKEFFKVGEELRRTIERKGKDVAKAQVRLSELNEKLNQLELSINSTNWTLDSDRQRRDELKQRVDGYSEILGKLESDTKELLTLFDGSSKELNTIDGDLTRKEVKKERLLESIETASKILEKASREVAKEEAFRQISEDLAGERTGQVKLQEICEGGGVPGYVGRLNQLVRFPQYYRRAVSAVIGRWLGAFVVEDLRSMTHLIKAAKGLNARTFSVIPLSEVETSTAVALERSAGVIGPLSGVLKSDSKYIGLVNFLAGDTLLVESEAIAYLVSSEGIRAVTLRGEVFEPGGKAFTFGYQEVLMNLMEGLENLEGISEIENAVGALKSAISRRRSELQSVEAASRTLTKERLKRVASISSWKAESAAYTRVSSRYRASFWVLKAEYDKRARAVERLETNMKSTTAKKEAIARGVTSLKLLIEETRALGLESHVAELDASKQSLLNDRDSLSNELLKANMDLSYQRAQLGSVLLPTLKNNQLDLEQATEDLQGNREVTKEVPRRIKDATERKNSLESKVKKLVETSKNSQPVLDEYDSKARRLRDERDSIGRSISSNQKELFALSSQIEGSMEKIEEALGSLRILGYEEEPEVFDGADQLLAQLNGEFAEVASSVNRGAARQYLEMYVSYKNLSTRNNELERERNSILAFIESVEAEKRKVFMSAFDKISNEFKAIFNRLTGGEAWLELEKPEDIFNGGMRLMARFENKPAWESLSLSGGEKAVSGVSLILAMQGVQPHPFYLFDEIDSPLDAINSGNLAEFLKERSEEAQIIAMSLRDVFVVHSSMTYGVYSAGGISRIVHYKPTEVTVRHG